MRHFMAACFLKDYQHSEMIRNSSIEPSVKDRNKLHRLLGLFTGPVNGVRVGKDLLLQPSPMIDQSRVETENRGTSSYSRTTRKPKTEAGGVPLAMSG